jgi:hypothetical protein
MLGDSDLEYGLRDAHRDRRRLHRAPPSENVSGARRLWQAMPLKSREESIPSLDRTLPLRELPQTRWRLEFRGDSRERRTVDNPLPGGERGCLSRRSPMELLRCRAGGDTMSNPPSSMPTRGTSEAFPPGPLPWFCSPAASRAWSGDESGVPTKRVTAGMLPPGRRVDARTRDRGCLRATEDTPPTESANVRTQTRRK